MSDRAMLDPLDPDFSMQQLDELLDLSEGVFFGLRRIVALLPRPSFITVDSSRAELFNRLSLDDPFTFDTENDALILFSRSEIACADALVELAMYLTGFATLMGAEDEWAVEFAIGAWRGVRNHIKRQFELPVAEDMSGIVGEPPPADAPGPDPYPFRTLVSSFDAASFYHMLVLAGREEIGVYFPPETNPKVLAVYVYSRRAMREIASGIDLTKYQEFNARLLNGIQRLDTLFWPHRSRAAARASRPDLVDLRHLTAGESIDDLLLSPGDEPDNPFAAFIDDLFPDEPEGGAE